MSQFASLPCVLHEKHVCMLTVLEFDVPLKMDTQEIEKGKIRFLAKSLYSNLLITGNPQILLKLKEIKIIT